MQITLNKLICSSAFHRILTLIISPKLVHHFLSYLPRHRNTHKHKKKRNPMPFVTGIITFSVIQVDVPEAASSSVDGT